MYHDCSKFVHISHELVALILMFNAVISSSKLNERSAYIGSSVITLSQFWVWERGTESQ
jgi:hypothetical protein